MTNSLVNELHVFLEENEPQKPINLKAGLSPSRKICLFASMIALQK